MPYGVVKQGQKVKRVHRLVWEDECGPIPGGFLVCHACDNPPCCNVRHLFLGTHSDNARDKVAKGRMPLMHGRMPRGDDHWSRRNPEKVARGHGHKGAKLTPDQVAKIRAEPQAWGVNARLAREYGVSHTTIVKIRRGTRYADTNKE